MLVPFVTALGGVILIATSVVGISQDHAFEARGKKAVLKPISRYIETTRRGNVTYSASLSFSTDSGRTVTLVDHDVSDQALRHFQAGDPVAIEYLEDDPLTIRFVGDPEKDRKLGIFLGVVLFLGGGFFFRRSLQSEN